MIAHEIVLGLGLLVIAVCLFYIAQRRLLSKRYNELTDGLIIGLGAWVLAWVYLIQPTITSTTSSSLTIARGVALGIAMIIIFLLATVLFADASTSPSVSFIGGASALVVTGIILRAVSVRTSQPLQMETVDAPLITAFFFSMSALIHPSSRNVLSRGISRITPPLMTRMVITTTSLIAPVVVLALTDAQDTSDRVVRTVSVSVLATVVMLRIIQSVRSNSHTQEQLMRNALTDSLTGLPNRVLMLQYIDSALHNSWKSTKQPTVLFIDVDRFKNINDSLGHSIGDDVLATVAKRLLQSISGDSTVARIAGDEFVILDPSTESPTQSVLLAERVLDAFRDPVHMAEGDMFVTASIGVAYAPQGVELSADQLMRHADTAMYRAKDAGRNCIAIFDDSMLETVTKRLDVETALYRALERDELSMVYQPIVDTNLSVVVGFEALMRWQREDGVAVSPADFIPIAEETGTIVPLGSWALNDALMQLRFWMDTGLCTSNTTINVNVSARQIHDPQFVTIVRDALTNSGISPSQLWLEVTESVMITEPTQALHALSKLNSLGVRIAIDDFGTGYSSLSLLQKFPIQCIKIDRSFVQHIVNEHETQSIVRTIVAMANTLGADIVAEGVEEADQLETLSQLSCYKAQGYFFSRPLTIAEVPNMVRSLQDIQK